MSREKILASISANQPQPVSLPEIPFFTIEEIEPAEKFTNVAVTIGAKVFKASNLDEIKATLKQEEKIVGRIVSTLQEFNDIAESVDFENTDPHILEDVELAIIRAEFAVAENSASWISARSAAERVLPFICQHLVILVQKDAIIPTMHKAYERIGGLEYEYATFIAGPSKTADIEQSLVLGAHGPRSLTVFILDELVRGGL